MNIKKFITRTVIKLIAFVVITTVALSMLNSPILTNTIALWQMENSNEAYLMMELFNKIKPIISIIYGCITACFVVTIIRDTYKFIQTKTKEKI